jgi:replicative DNA helicase
MTEKEINLLLTRIKKRKEWMINHSVLSPSLEEIQFEKTILGSVISYNTLINELFDFIYEDFFLDSKHQKVMSAITEIYCISAPINIPYISKLLKEKDEYEFVGGQAFLEDLLNYSLINEKK